MMWVVREWLRENKTPPRRSIKYHIKNNQRRTGSCTHKLSDSVNKSMESIYRKTVSFSGWGKLVQRYAALTLLNKNINNTTHFFKNRCLWSKSLVIVWFLWRTNGQNQKAKRKWIYPFCSLKNAAGGNWANFLWINGCLTEPVHSKAAWQHFEKRQTRFSRAVSRHPEGSDTKRQLLDLCFTLLAHVHPQSLPAAGGS